MLNFMYSLTHSVKNDTVIDIFMYNFNAWFSKFYGNRKY